MTPDEFATFLSGIFAPLAFLWLVLGYHQQGVELRNSSEALRLQGDELRSSVEHQAELARVAREQLSFERESFEAELQRLRRQAQPDLVFIGGGSSSTGGRLVMHFELLNRGSQCSDLRLHLPEGRVLRRPLLERGQRMELNFAVSPTDPLGDRPFLIEYLDNQGEEGEVTLHLTACRVGDGVQLQIPA